MKFGFRTAAACMLLLVGYGFGRAQNADSRTISLGLTTLHIGMARDSAIAALSVNYNIDDKGIVMTKKGPPYDAVGSVVFKDGRLSQVWKDWSANDQEQSFELANNMYGLFDGLKREGRTACIADTGVSQGPKGESKAIFFNCGNKEIRVDVSEWRDGDQMRRAATLTEVLR
jgi:hypothetical protein